MIDAYYEEQDQELSSSSCSSSQLTTVNSMAANATTTTTPTTPNYFDLIKDYLISKNGKVKLNELNKHFKELEIDSNSLNFQDLLANLTTRKHDTNSKDDLIILKKCYKSEAAAASPTTSHGYFANKIQKTKQTLSKAFSKGLEKDFNKSLNLSTNSSNSSTSSFHASSSSFSASNLTETSIFTKQAANNLHRKSSLVSSNPSIDSSSTTNNISKPLLSSTSTKTDLHEIFELDKLINNLSLSKSNTEQMNNEIENYECIDINNDNDDDDDDENENQQDVAVLSVKEQAKKINRLSTKSDLRNDLTPKLRKNSSSKELEINKPIVPVKNIEIESIELSNPTQIEKDWLLICSRCNYMEMAKILSKNPFLAQKKDPFTGYTCAHWACKYGNIEILKLIASTLENDTKTNPKSIRINNLINSRTRAGYTCLHIAYIFKHSTDLVSILKRYGAEGFVDYSGKQALEYSKSMQNTSIIPQDSQDFKSNQQDQITEIKEPSTAASFVKRTSSILMPKGTRDMFLMNNSHNKSNENKQTKYRSSSSRPYETNTLSSQIHKNYLPPSPLATKDSIYNNCNNNNNNNSILMPPPSTTNTTVLFRNAKKLNSINDDSIYQNNQDQNNFRESKENIFI